MIDQLLPLALIIIGGAAAIYLLLYIAQRTGERLRSQQPPELGGSPHEWGRAYDVAIPPEESPHAIAGGREEWHPLGIDLSRVDLARPGGDETAYAEIDARGRVRPVESNVVKALRAELEELEELDRLGIHRANDTARLYYLRQYFGIRTERGLDA